MKATQIITAALLIFVSLFFACKKKKDSTPPPASNTTGTAPVLNSMTAKIDGNDWSMENSPFSAVYISKSSGFYGFGGQSSFNNPKTIIQLGFEYGIGTYTIGTSSGISATYKDTANIYYNAATGTVNITQLDTLPSNAGIINKFKATFSFQTYTYSGKSYSITNGTVDFDKSR